jgi:hypothetical protein
MLPFVFGRFKTPNYLGLLMVDMADVWFEKLFAPTVFGR